MVATACGRGTATVGAAPDAAMKADDAAGDVEDAAALRDAAAVDAPPSASADAAPGDAAATDAPPDGRPGTPDAPSGTPDARPGTPDAPDEGTPDAAPDDDPPDAAPGTPDAPDDDTPDAAPPVDGFIPPDSLSPPGGAGHITYAQGGAIYRIEATPGAVPENLSLLFDLISPGNDAQVNLSPDGEWILFETTRFGCAGYHCLALASADLSDVGRLEVGGVELHTSGRHPAVASGGDLVVYPRAGTHSMDLFVTQRGSSGWTTPVNITADSPFEFQHDPALSADGSKVVFDCGPEPYGVTASAICEVHTDGTAFRVVLYPDDGGHPPDSSLHQPDYAPDGSIVFESDWNAEQIWRLDVGATTPTLVTPSSIHNDNSPCVLPDGRIASLWLNRPGGIGFHELKDMAADGTSDFMLVVDVDIADIGQGCGL